MSASSEERVSGLVEAVAREDHNEVYEFSKQLLRDYPEDLAYAHCFVLSSLRMGVGEELGQQQFRHPPSDPALQELYAYYLYDRGSFEKVIEYVQSLPPTATLSLLQAQAHFRHGQYPQAALIMQGLLRDSALPPEDRQEYSINLLACGLNPHLTSPQLQLFRQQALAAQRKELLYNYALVLWAAGDRAASQHWLGEFERGLTPGPDDEDIATVRLFRDYAEWEGGALPDRSALAAYESLLERVGSRNLRGVVENNLLFVRGALGGEGSQEHLRVVEETLASEYRMTAPQRTCILLNKLTLLLRKGRSQEAGKLVRELEGTAAASQLPEFIKNKYYLLRRAHEDKLQLEYAEWVGSLHPHLGFCLRADALRGAGREEALIAELRRGGERAEPAARHFIFGLLVRNKGLLEEYSDYLGELGEASDDLGVLEMLLSVYEAKGDAPRQRQLLEKSHRLHPKNTRVRAKLAQALLEQGQLGEAEEVLRGIQPPEELPDAGHLQFIEKNIHLSVQKEQASGPEEARRDEPQRKRIRKKKKVRLPKNVEKPAENYKGDPERWLPKWQRKGYKKKGRKGAGKTQGLATVGREEKNVYAAGTSTSNKEVTKASRKKNR